MNDKNNEVKKDDGLPEVAQKRASKPVVIVLAGVFFAIFIGSFFMTKVNKETEKPVEDTYTIPTAGSEDNKSQPAVAGHPAGPEANQPSQETPAETQQKIAFIQEKQKELQQRLSSPLMLFNANQAESASAASAQDQPKSKDANTQFMQQLSNQKPETSSATVIGPLNYVIAQGSMIHAILESATNSDLPGMIRAIVSEPSYSEDGTQVLIPRGARLIGQYKSGMLQGQTRIFIVWTRMIAPNGVSIDLGSPGVDSLGVAGMAADEVDNHFWARFGTASLLSLIGTGAANVGVSGQDQDNSSSDYREAVASSFSQSANQSLQQDGMMPPTLKTYQGKPIMVFVAKDLNFQAAMAQANPKVQIF